jgi:predicted TIM-barrel fold metal-dependent hydrolase
MMAFASRFLKKIRALTIRWVVVIAGIVVGSFWIGHQSLVAAPPPETAAVIPFIDVHTHMDERDDAGMQSILDAMKRENASKIFLLVPPYAYEDPAIYDTEPLLQIAKAYPDKLVVLGGGGSLSAMIQQSVATGDAGPAIQQKFKARAEEILKEGAVGFGELTTEHFPSAGSALYQYAPVDHPLLLLLADIAAQHNVPIELHIEAVPQDMPVPAEVKSPPAPPRLHENIAPLERLLDHNPRAKIVWAHVGADNTGYRTPELCRRLLQTHKNLYMEIKIDPFASGKNPVLVDGKIPPVWLKLFEEFPDRFVLGSDQHYPEPAKSPQRWESLVTLYNQLPPNLQKQIGTQNALHIYDLKSGN